MLAGFVAFTVLAVSIGYVGATGYLIFRDDLLNVSHTRQASIQFAYEDRLAQMRTEIDRITSRQMLDQRSVEHKIDELLDLKTSVDSQNSTLAAIKAAAKLNGIDLPTLAPTPRPKPLQEANNTIKQTQMIDPTTTSSLAYVGASAGVDPFSLAFNNAKQEPETPPSRPIKENGELDLKQIETTLIQRKNEQIRLVKHLTHRTKTAASDIENVIRSMGYRVRASAAKPNGIGGPFVPANAYETSIEFDNTILAFKENLEYLQSLKQQAALFPLRRPLKTGSLSSSFGRRVDPFLNRYAFHAGVDYRAPTGTSVFATAPGKIVKASRSGGYGQLIEIEHFGGITTRYAHLSRINVKVGERVKAGQFIGRVGSTGRSTGPHLHYETRMNDKAKDPARFLNAGRKINQFL